ncbi:uncharacterized protein F4822DRAFT_129360 [Hypoxylon trugodes]|uniref:uncharacterized protein n=1 Tax=Hypoxylon trugodes TaxID=326681 RepID=UPI002198923C|nr:uncharacterized protein F4822DRAFT_129360 [Hypoxylon trugodes]KAI1392431.1 hypothetical protein F4822DRAFT_129360 [Hypoxylon trugodes]
MELTPLKVRGKGRRLDAPTAAPRRKRRKIKPKNLLESRMEKASWLEKVPLEIMEQIFWLSGNVNLPRSSPLIGKLLSGKSTLRETLISAFDPSWDWYFGVTGIMDYNDILLDIGDPEFQSSLLECPWADISFILECWDLWVRRRAKKPFRLKHIRPWGDPDNIWNVMGEDEHLLVDPQKASHCFYHDYAAFRQIEELNKETLSHFGDEPRGERFRQLHSDTRIPDSLFMSPLDGDALQKFFWLVRAGVHLSSEQTWEVTLQAFRHAVPQESPRPGQLNLTVVRLLDALMAFVKWPEHILDAEIERIDSLRSLTEDAKEANPPSALTREAFGYNYIHKRLIRARQSDGNEYF